MKLPPGLADLLETHESIPAKRLDGAEVFSVTTDDGEEHLVWSEENENTHRHMSSSIVMDNGEQLFAIAVTHASARELASSIAKAWNEDEPIPQPFLNIRPTTFPGHERKDGTLTVIDRDQTFTVDTWRADVSLVTFNPMDHSKERPLFVAAFKKDSFTQAATAFFALDRFAEGGLAALRKIASSVVNDPADEDAAEKLALETLGHVSRLKRSSSVFTTPPKPGEENAPDDWRDAFATFIEKTGKAGAARAAKVREGGSWRFWCNPEKPQPFGFVEAVMRAVWLDVVKPQLERLKRNPVALVLPVHEDVTAVHSRAFLDEKSNGQRSMIFDKGAPRIVTAEIVDSALMALVERGAKLLGSQTGHRVLRWELVEGHRRMMEGVADPRVLRIDTGWGPFAERLGMKSKQDAYDLRAIVHAQNAVHLSLPNGGSATLIALREQPAQGRRHGVIEITLGTMLLPHFQEELKGNALDAREARRLVPVIATLPPVVGRSNEHGKQVTLSMLIVREMRLHARTLFVEGAIPITTERLNELARDAGLHHNLVPRIIDRWTQDGDDGPAFLEQPQPGFFRLGKVHAAEHAFLLEAGKREVDGAKGGRLGVAKRNAKRRRLTGE